MKKIFNKFSKYIFEILVLLVIIVIGLYIIHFAESITDKTEKLLAAFAATLSTFFLFLAFWQSKLSNELKINEPRFKRYEKEITELEKKSNEFIFTKDKTQEISCGIKYFDNVINNVTYLNFNKELISLFNHIEAV